MRRWPQTAWSPRTLARIGQVVVVVAIGLFALLAGTGHLDRLSLDTPGVMWPLVVGAVILVPTALFRRSIGWWTRTMPVLAAGAAGFVSAIAWYLRASDTITDAYPPSFLFWAAAAIVTVVGVAVGWRRAGPGQRLAGLVAAPLCVAATVVLINTHYGYWPTLGDLLGHPVTGQISEATLRQELAQGSQHQSSDGGAGGQSALSVNGRYDGEGQFAVVDIPATVSHFHHRHAGVYLPPAYFTSARHDLPVLIMLAGTPSEPTTLATAGGALTTANRFAATHDGQAPVMLFPDANGSLTGDTECVNGPRGQAETYLSVDVVNYATHVLHLTRDPRRWAIVGFSEGGTCALDLALRHRSEFRTFVDLAGDWRPVLTHDVLDDLYGGSPLAALHYSPDWLMAHRRYVGDTAWFASGEHDPGHLRVTRAQVHLARAAGMRAWSFVGPDGHDFKFATYAIRQLLPQLFAHLDSGPEVI
jgi:S-formylglutathione hydrolase FrmB